MSQLARTGSGPPAERGTPVWGAAALSAALTPAAWLRLGTVATLLLVLYWHVVQRLVTKWYVSLRQNGDWSHGFIIPLFSLYYLYLQRDRYPGRLSRASVGSAIGGGSVMIASFAVYLACTTWLQMDYPKSLSLVAMMFGAIWMVCGWPIARWSWFAVAFLLFALPLPDRLYVQLTMPLQQIASMAAAPLLGLLPGMEDTQVTGVVIEYLYHGVPGRLNVAEACSGIRSMMALTALGVAMAFMWERALWQRMVMILSCVPIAIFCNAIRVTVSGVFHAMGYENLAVGTPHALLGLMMLALAVTLYAGLSYVLGNLMIESEEAGTAGPVGA